MAHLFRSSFPITPTRDTLQYACIPFHFPSDQAMIAAPRRGGVAQWRDAGDGVSLRRSRGRRAAVSHLDPKE